MICDLLGAKKRRGYILFLKWDILINFFKKYDISIKEIQNLFKFFVFTYFKFKFKIIFSPANFISLN